jgi:hypothetical protein
MEPEGIVDFQSANSINDIHDLFFNISTYYAVKGHDLAENEPFEDFEHLRYLSINNELFVRTPTYPHHLKYMLLDVFGIFDDWFLQNLGFTVRDTITIEESISSLINNKVANLKTQIMEYHKCLIKELRKFRETNEKYNDILLGLADVSWENANKKLNLRVGEKFIASLGNAYSFTVEEISGKSDLSKERIQAYLDYFSIGFGSIDPITYMFSPTHELKERPFINHQRKYICANPQLVLWSIQPALERALNPQVLTSVNKSKVLWDRYVDSRANYVERESIKLLLDALKYAIGYNNLTYKIIKDGSARQYELDGLIIYDGNLFLLESKASSFTPPARRGAKDRLLKDIKELIVKAHDQALRARDYIDSNESPKFILDDKREIIIDKTTIKRTFLITISLNQLDAFTTSLNKTAK